MILATQTGGKHGAGFRKAKGRGSIATRPLLFFTRAKELKCQSTVPSQAIGLRIGSHRQVPDVILEVSMGQGGMSAMPEGLSFSFTQGQAAPEKITHNFAAFQRNLYKMSERWYRCWNSPLRWTRPAAPCGMVAWAPTNASDLAKV